MFKFKAVIFDLDGVLVDSEFYWEGVARQFFAAHHLEMPPGYIERTKGLNERDIARWLIKELAFKSTEEDILNEREEMSESVYTQKCRPLPGIEKLLLKVKAGGLKAAINSGSDLRRIKIVIDRFGWKDYFDELISSHDTDMPGKPDSETYLVAARILKVAPAECVAIEDASSGVISAKNAGLTCIALSDRSSGFGDFNRADLIVESFKDDKIYEFLGI